MPSKQQIELAKLGVSEQQGRADYMNFLYDRSGRHDLPEGKFPHAVFTGLSDEFALEVGKDVVKDIADGWHRKNAKEWIQYKYGKKTVETEDNETKN